MPLGVLFPFPGGFLYGINVVQQSATVKKSNLMPIPTGRVGGDS